MKKLLWSLLLTLLTIQTYGQSSPSLKIVQPDSVINYNGEQHIHLPEGFYKFIRVKSNTRVIIDGDLVLSDLIIGSKEMLEYGDPIISDTTTLSGYHHIGNGCTVILEPNAHLEIHGRFHDLATQLSILLKEHSQIIVNNIFTFNLESANPDHVISFGSGSQIIAMGKTDINLKPIELTDHVNQLNKYQLALLTDIGRFLIANPMVDITNDDDIDRGVLQFMQARPNPRLANNTLSVLPSETSGYSMPLTEIRELFRKLFHTFDNQVRFLHMGPWTNFSHFYFELEHAYTDLPVELSNFKVERNSEHTFNASWSTETEINADHFTLEVSSDNIHYKLLEEDIPAFGNSNTHQEYTINDLPFSSNHAYVRLTEVDFDGLSQSWVREIHAIENEFSYQQIYPVPANNILHVSLNNSEMNGVQFDLVEASTGKIVFDKQYREVQEVDIDTSNLKDGIYVLNAHAGSKNIHSEVVVLH
ncbi:T9SS type A sorting domain-containing protein [Flammeovirga yaeyamensis]|uniref:T9SS type A sorting domain-containing protein n=1 Tax=Flammeovirga yaeyamensis TaxID=367791 RepID=A0AAX1N4A1_9BACT|nr:T9SS type A sorting domain-containing protein [Flammeovirga yaeyamensis]MBB3701462.1 hypothetical protein [Flammeovirga yaeyamensis]NMF38506.1 T9SS type A sorting domain-containing protein [Flammeovirga yaeyamensis]QWG02413.1 T9SS type A sorting domain-containing protein [Flammeovirga yaeyamensis]